MKAKTMKMAAHQTLRTRAWQFVVLVGVVSLFADMTYEGARSITGQYLALLGASATVIGIVAGLGEFIGYAFRLLSGVIADKTKRYWALTLFGYTINLTAVPVLALAGRWETAAALMFAERFGKALRTPARYAMLSYAASQTGQGMAFGIHEALDQIGAVLGPLLMTIVLQWRNNYRFGFFTLLAPALLALFTLLIAWRFYPQPQHLELTPTMSSTALPRRFWRYLVFASLAVVGFPHFQLLAYHFKFTASLPEALIPIAFGLSMATDAIAALAMGRWFDRIGLTLLATFPLLTFAAALALFTRLVVGAWLGMVLWGIVMGAQESVMRADIAEMAAQERRVSAYGIFNTAYGLVWLLGGTAMGWLYDHHSVSGLLILVALTQIVSLPFLFGAIKPEGREAQ